MSEEVQELMQQNAKEMSGQDEQSSQTPKQEKNQSHDLSDRRSRASIY